jgi:hypothetical protein
MYIDYSHWQFSPGRRKKLSLEVLKGLHDLREFENERFLPFIGILCVDLEGGGYRAGVMLEYEVELKEQLLLLTQLTERPEQQLLLFRRIDVSFLWRRIDQRHLIQIIGAFGLSSPAETTVDVVVYYSLEPSLI